MNAIREEGEKLGFHIKDTLEDQYYDLHKTTEKDESIFFYDTVNGRAVFNQCGTVGITLGNIEEFVRAASRGGEPYTVVKRGLKTFANKNRLAVYYKFMKLFLVNYSIDRVYSPYVQVFFDVCIKEKKLTSGTFPDNEYHPSSAGKEGWEIFGDVVRAIQEKVASASFKNEIYKQNNLLKKAFNSSLNYVDALFERFSRILVIRIDVSFHSSEIFSDEPITLEEVQAYFLRFLNNRRSKAIYKNLVGYIWRMESGIKKGHHYHLFFFFDGSKSHQDSYLAMRIGEDWVAVTDSKGIYYNCNVRKQGYKHLAIGMVSHDDMEKRAAISDVLLYMHKQSQILKEKNSLKSKTWGRGEMPKTRKDVGGRPRQIRT